MSGGPTKSELTIASKRTRRREAAILVAAALFALGLGLAMFHARLRAMWSVHRLRSIEAPVRGRERSEEIDERLGASISALKDLARHQPRVLVPYLSEALPIPCGMRLDITIASILLELYGDASLTENDLRIVFHLSQATREDELEALLPATERYEGFVARWEAIAEGDEPVPPLRADAR